MVWDVAADRRRSRRSTIQRRGGYARPYKDARARVVGDFERSLLERLMAVTPMATWRPPRATAIEDGALNMNRYVAAPSD